MTEEQELENQMVELLQKLRASKQQMSGEQARRVQITITEYEKMLAYYHAYVVNNWTV